MKKPKKNRVEKPTKRWLESVEKLTQEEVHAISWQKKGKPVFTKPLLLRALKLTVGIVGTACDMCNISRAAFYKYCDNDADFKEKVKEITEYQIDFVESKMLKLISLDNPQLIQFYMSRKGHKRGYGDNQFGATDNESNQPAKATITLPDGTIVTL